ncbi:ABC transporter permease [Nocardia cyriacigeorgica]|uniref:Transport permease protein n=1 Tax=Nocardia cyriacigeorgica TaxID=135487 RepID=A0A5R8P2I6_9NOCA|nr:ABC transporter permease [Nocardia cyriacigeorgica]TLF82497.1 peptide ABC transporter permease [Nocardia cyriacigeorgica]
MSSVQTPETVEAPSSAQPGWNTPLPTVHARSEGSLGNWWTHSLIQTKRLLLVWARDPATTIQTILYPALTLLMFWIVLGDSITAATGKPSVYGTVPMITLVAAMAGAVVSALGFKTEKATGLLGRFWTMPVHRAAGLTGRLFAEAIRVLVTTLFVIAVGFCIGFRFDQGPVAALALIGIPVLFGVGFAVFVTALATLTEGVMLVNVIGIINTLLMFFNSGFVPVYAYPVWLQDIVANQPMSCAIDAMRGLSYGGPVAEPMLETLLWTVGIVVVFAYPAVRGYRRAAETGA